MSGSERKSKGLNRQAPRRLPGSIVLALWAVAVAWIAVDPLTGSHSSATSRWMENVSLIFVSMACTTLIAWLIQVLVITPYNTQSRIYELGYQAGRHDEQEEQHRVRADRPEEPDLPSGGRPTLNVVTNDDDEDGKATA